MPAAFKYLKRACPVCDGMRNDCRQSATTGAVHCRADATPTGWEATGFDSQGFTIYVLGKDASDPAYWAERQRRREESKKAAQDALAQLLTIPQRDRMYRTVAGHSGLTQQHRQQLEQRCIKAQLPVEVIGYLLEQKLLFSWQPGQDFPGVTAALPGTDRFGKLNRRWKGWAIGVPDAHGRILGFQIKPEEGGGYFWASSANGGGNGPYLPNGELPMGIYWPSELRRTDRIGLAEGYLKPALAAERLGIPFIGMSGGHFPPQQFEQALATIHERLPYAQLMLYPDAGMLTANHSNVHSAWKKLDQLCQKLGEPLQAAWWGQSEKLAGDVDETPIIKLQNAKRLSLGELLGKVTQSAQEDWSQRWQEQARKSWDRTRTFTPDAVVNSRFVETSLADVMSHDIHALKSGMGTGKTHAIAQLLQQTEMGVVAIGSRNSLLLQSCERWGGFYHLHGDGAFGLTADPHSRIACCIDSLVHFGDGHFDGKIIILDEVLSVVKHALLSSTLKDKREKALSKFEKAMQSAAAIIAWDGNNADIVINYLSALRGDHCRVRKILNQWEAASLNVEMARVLASNGNVWISNNKPVLAKVGEALRVNRQLGNGKGTVVIADSQRLLEAMDRVYSDEGFRVLRVDSETVSGEDIREFLKNPDTFIADTRPDLLLMSPTAESGIDISIADYFSHGFAFFFGNIDTATQLQFFRRVRKCLDWTCWCVEYKAAEDADGCRSPLPRKVGAQLQAYIEEDVLNAFKGEATSHAEDYIQRLKEQASTVHYQAALQFTAARNYEKQHTRECLQIALEEAGHQVALVDIAADGENADATALSTAKEDIEVERCQKIFDAPDITAAQAAKIASSFSATPEDRHAADKAILKGRLPGIDHSPIWSAEFIRTVLFDDRGLIRRLERWWMLNHMEAAKVRSRETYLQVLEYGGFPLDIKSDLRLLQALKHLGIDQLPTMLGLFDNAHSTICQMWERCKRSKRLQEALGRSPGKLKPMDWIGRLCRIVGISTKAHPKPRARRNEDGGIRSYSYHAPDADPTAAEILKCLDQRFQKYLNPETAETDAPQDSDPVHLTPSTSILQGEGEPPQTQAAIGAYGFSAEEWAEVAELARQATAEGGETLAEFRALFPQLPDEFWRDSA
jgi:hypothetical protein